MIIQGNILFTWKPEITCCGSVTFNKTWSANGSYLLLVSAHSNPIEHDSKLRDHLIQVEAMQSKAVIGKPTWRQVLPCCPWVCSALSAPFLTLLLLPLHALCLHCPSSALLPLPLLPLLYWDEYSKAEQMNETTVHILHGLSWTVWIKANFILRNPQNIS